MFGILRGLTKAVVGVVVETPAALIADFATLGGALTEKDKPYTVRALERVVENIESTVKPDDR